MIQELLDRADAMPDDSCGRQTPCRGDSATPCIAALASLGRVDPPAAFAAADALMKLLGGQAATTVPITVATQTAEG